MKIKNINTFLFVAIIFASCTSRVEVVPTGTTIPSSAAKPALPETPSNTPDPRVVITIDAETYRVTSDVMYSEIVKNLVIDPTMAQVAESPAIESLVGKILWYKDNATNTRYIWNEHMAAWIPVFGISTDFRTPEASPTVPFDAYYDGSAMGVLEYIPSSSTLSDALYVAEHPGLIAPNASYPYYRVTLFGNDKAMIGYQIVLTGPNQYLLIDENTTQLSNKQPLPFNLYGIQQTKDKGGHIIYVMKKANWNPTNVNSPEILVTNMGFDKSAYDEWFQYPLILRYIANDSKVTGGELSPLFLSPDGQFQETNPDLFYFETQPANPHLASLLSADAIRMFDLSVQADILSLYPQINKPFNADNNPGSYLIGSLPSELSNMILYTGVHQFYV